MHLLVFDEGRELGEAFATARALVRLFPGVNPFVSGERYLLRKHLPALRAQIRFLSRVDPLVDGETQPLAEAFPALHAGVPAADPPQGPRVDSPAVYGEVRPVGEGLIAAGARERPLPVVAPVVRFEVPVPSKTLPAL